jgi:hypothetical protein
MKYIPIYKMTRSILVITAAITLLASSCKKTAYLTDGGTSVARTPLSTYDYLKAHPYHYFDTVLLIIDHFNLKDSVNKSGTFFAFTDYSVHTLMTLWNYTSLDSLYAHVSSRFLTQYMFSDSSLSLANATTAAVIRPDWAGDSATAAIRKIQKSYPVYLVNSSPTFNYYTLQYIKVNGVLDNSPGAPASDPPDTYISCQTTGILTSSGTTLHVLVDNAPLNKL